MIKQIYVKYTSFIKVYSYKVPKNIVNLSSNYIGISNQRQTIYTGHSKVSGSIKQAKECC